MVDRACRLSHDNGYVKSLRAAMNLRSHRAPPVEPFAVPVSGDTDAFHAVPLHQCGSPGTGMKKASHHQVNAPQNTKNRFRVPIER
jgi:hypothetical protein